MCKLNRILLAHILLLTFAIYPCEEIHDKDGHSSRFALLRVSVHIAHRNSEAYLTTVPATSSPSVDDAIHNDDANLDDTLDGSVRGSSMA